MPGWNIPDLIVVRPRRLNFVLETYVRLPFVGAATTRGIRLRRLDEVSRGACTTDRAYFAQLTW